MTNPDISTWLTEMGLENQIQAFADNRIDFDVLSDLSEADLRELGLPLGDRKRLLKAIESLLDEGLSETKADGPEGGRRQVAVLFADISGFTTLAAARDAEEIHQLLNRFFTAVDGVVQSFGGSIDKHIGDAVMAVFGAPVAHTDDPERAIRAALALHDAAAELEPPLRIHVGIAAGQVVASSTGSAAHREYTVTGDTVNLASRLTDLARAGETLISASVQDELDDRLDGESLGAQSLPGLPEPVPIWRVNGMAEARVFAAGSFIGRAAEIEIFQDALDTTLRQGRGLTLFIRGEAGIGKTRLLYECQRLARIAGFHHHGGQVLDFGVGEGQDAIGILLRGLLDLTPGAGRNQRTAAAQTAAEAGLIGPEQRLHLNDLLSLPQNPEEAILYEAMDNEQRNRGRVDALVTLVKGLSKQAPLLLEIENLHWAQPALLDYLTALAVAAGEHRILLLLSSRVQGDPLNAAWYDGIAPAPARILDLKPLTTDEAHDFIFDFEGVDRERAAACIERSGGNPLFLEQLLRSPGGDDGALIPGSVQSVVQARIDALPARDRAALQAASVLGQRFALDAMRHVMNDSAYQPDDLLHFNMIRRSEGAFQYLSCAVPGCRACLVPHGTAAEFTSARGGLVSRPRCRAVCRTFGRGRKRRRGHRLRAGRAGGSRRLSHRPRLGIGGSRAGCIARWRRPLPADGLPREFAAGTGPARGCAGGLAGRLGTGHLRHPTLPGLDRDRGRQPPYGPGR